MENLGSVETSVRDILRPLFKHKLMAVIITIIIMSTIYITMQFRTPMYTSSVTMLVTGTMQKDLEVERSLGPGALIETYMSLVQSKPVLERVVRALKLHERPIDYEQRFAKPLKKKILERNIDNFKKLLAVMTDAEREFTLYNRAVSDLRGKVSAGFVGKTSMFTISVSEFDPRAAAVIANVVSRSYLIFDLEQQIAELLLIYGKKNITIEKLENYITKLEVTLDGRILSDLEAHGPASVKIVSQAGIGHARPMRPSATSAYIIGIMLSILVSIIIALGLDYVDNTLSSPGDIENFLNVPFLGSIPKRTKGSNYLIKHTNSSTKYTHSYKNLFNRIYMLIKENKFKTVILADAEGSKENSAVIANLGILSSRNTGQKVLIIDADLRSGAISQIFNISDSDGLSDVLNGKITFKETIQDLGHDLNIVPSGKTVQNPLILLSSSKMYDLVKKAEGVYDMVFIHCADIINHSESVNLSSCANSVVLIVSEGVVKRHILQNALDPFIQKDINIMGAVLSNRRYVIPEILYKLT